MSKTHMKKKFLFLLLLIVGFIIFIGVRFYTLNKTTQGGRLKITASPAASVFIDSAALGRTPFEQKMKEGDYTIKLIPEGVNSQTVSWQGKVHVYKDTMTVVNRELGSSDVSSAGETLTITKMDTAPKNGNNGEVSIESEPNGAIVYLDNDEKGVSPLLMQDVIKGDHEISVFLPGFFRRTTKINVDAGNRTSVRFSLAVDATAKNVDQLRKQKEESRLKEASESAKTEADKKAASTTQVTIQTTPTGFLRVRQDPSTTAEEVARVKPDEKYELIEETDGWYKIKLNDGKVGWISSEFAVKEGAAAPTDKPAKEDQ